MKHLRNIARGPRSTPRAPPKQMCTHFKNVYAFQITFCVHNFSLIINDLTQCVQCVRDVHPFLSCFKHFSKTRFYFINRTSI